MVSTYGYITIAELEAYTGINYETTSAVYTDAFVEAHISMAERTVNTICIEAPGATDASFVATMVLSERIMRSVMVEDGFSNKESEANKAFFDYLINIVLKSSKYTPCGIVPMSGADR